MDTTLAVAERLQIYQTYHENTDFAEVVWMRRFDPNSGSWMSRGSVHVSDIVSDAQRFSDGIGSPTG